jgi:hypothetical protein
MKQIVAACLALLLVTAPACAQSWATYTDDVYGFQVDVPADYRHDPLGAIQRFISPDGRIEISVLPGRLFKPLETMISEEIAQQTSRDWRIDDARTTPGWASFTMRRSGFAQFSRAEQICPDSSFVRVDIGYGEAETARLLPIIDHVAESLRPTWTVACSN